MAGIPSPTGKFRRFFARPYVYDFPIAAFAAFAGLASFLTAKRAGNVDAAWCWLLGAGGVCLFSTIKIVAQWRNSAAQESLHPLDAAMHVVHSSLMRFADSENTRLRVTLYRPKNLARLEQVTNYVGESERRSTAGRDFDNRCGIIGFAYREQQALFATFEGNDRNALIEVLMRDWHFDAHDAAALTPDVCSWMAIPLTDNKNVIGLVYCDATVPGFFENPEVQTVAVNASLGIARYVAWRYS